ncbi:hypothetical protein Adt_40465 [Abeliophyllum distichum]|uniref:Uncharacterized protein n=1 Tax=Abeliophyllum distichum TaxID=126358 RepID=A0ABD1QB95_9LAMI
MMRQQQGVERSKATCEIKSGESKCLEDKEGENIEELMKESLEKECIGKSRFENRKKDEDDSGRLITIQFGTLPPVMASNYLLAKEFKNNESDEVITEEIEEVACVLECGEVTSNEGQVTHGNSEEEDDGMTDIEEEIDLEVE